MSWSNDWPATTGVTVLLTTTDLVEAERPGRGSPCWSAAGSEPAAPAELARRPPPGRVAGPATTDDRRERTEDPHGWSGNSTGTRTARSARLEVTPPTLEDTTCNMVHRDAGRRTSTRTRRRGTA
ncbi:hypothetical protein [Streptomyces stelliscabiei]|uniref:hypothetical protein n=1 Tax=Streptomyces stelliscabiei TaxID=146820 RepID=UPI002FF02BBE